jgi:glycosyltransferase involved in cell wall biosynthesis
MMTGKDIVCVGFADWDTELWTNQHHLMSRLARQNRVLFVESLGLRRPQLAGRDVARIARRLRRGVAPPRAVDGLHVLSPLVLPLHSSGAVRALNGRILRALVRRAARRLGMSRPILWAYVPQAEGLIEVLDPELVVYHCVDDIAAQAGIDGASFRAAERRFVGRTNLVLASAPALAARMRELVAGGGEASGHEASGQASGDGANEQASGQETSGQGQGRGPAGSGARTCVVEAPNVADTALFATALQDGPIDAALLALHAPRIVFTGAIVATKLDVPLLVALARARPQWSFALVGPTGLGDPRTDVSALAQEHNIHLLGPRAYTELPAVLRGADAGIIPYAQNALTRSIFPMKVYEYLAAGLPVLATPLPALAGVAEVRTAADAQEMARLLEEALAEDTPERRRERSRQAAAHSWDRRLEEIAAAVAAAQQRR